MGCFQYSSISELKERIDLANDMDIDIVELRLDYLSPANGNKQILKEIKEITKKPIILTIRDIKEGGAYDYPVENKIQLVLGAIELCYNYIDIEVANWADYSTKISSIISTTDTKVILSWHGKLDLGSNQLEEILERIRIFNPAISKIAVECESASFASKFESSRDPSVPPVILTIFDWLPFSIKI